jgi:hypothetical protein
MLWSASVIATTPSGRKRHECARLLGLALAACTLLGAAAGAPFPGRYRVAIVSLVPASDDVSIHVEFGDPPATLAAPAPLPRTLALAHRAPEAPPLHARPGERRSWWVRWYDGTGRDRRDVYRRGEAVLTHATPHADIWIARDLLGTLDPQIVARLPGDVESAYAALHGRFGSLSYSQAEIARHGMVAGCESSTPSRRTPYAIPAFVPSRGELLSVLIVAASAAHYGYADLGSYRYQAALNCSGGAKSNELPGLFVWALDTDAPRETLAATLVTRPAHELQHLKNFVRHAIRSVPSVRQTPLLNEGLSMLAQDFAVQRSFGARVDALGAGALANEYLAQPNLYSALTFAVQDGAVQRPFTGGSYGAAYLLQRFLYDRFGDAYLDAVTDTDQVDLAAMERATGMPTAEIMRAFARSLLDAATAPLPSADFRIVGGSISLFTSTRPIAEVRARGGSVVWVQTRAGD